MYKKIDTGEILTFSQVKQLFPYTSFAGELTSDNCIDFGLEWYDPPPAQPTSEQILKVLINSVQIHLDTIAKTRNYDGILSACSYATSTDPVFSAEGQACVVFRDSVWRTCYDIMADVNNGIRPIPTPQELISELPTIQW